MGSSRQEMVAGEQMLAFKRRPPRAEVLQIPASGLFNTHCCCCCLKFFGGISLMAQCLRLFAFTMWVASSIPG